MEINVAKQLIDYSGSSTLTVTGTQTVTGAVTNSGAVTNTGAVTNSSTTEMTGNVTVNTNKVTIAASSGNTLIAGTLGVTGTTTMAGAVATSVDAASAANLPVGGTTATAVTIGKAGTTAGYGVRVGASRVVLGNKPTAPVDIAGGVTATVTQILEAGIFLCSASATLTLPTMAGATGLVRALPGTPAVGDIITFVQVVAAGQTATLAAGTGSTLAGIATTAAAATGRVWFGRVTSVTTDSETVTWY